MWQGWEEMAMGPGRLAHMCVSSENSLDFSCLPGPHHSLVKGSVPPMVPSVPGPQVSGVNLTLSLE